MAETPRTPARKAWVRAWLIALEAGVIFAAVEVVGALLLDRADLDARITMFTAALALLFAVEARWPKTKDGAS